MKCYIVGGWVRDLLCNRTSTDKDWVVVGGSALILKELGFEQVGASFPVFLHPTTKEEYALARSERKKGQGYHGFEINSATTITLEDDLRRRDLTINAIAFDPLNKKIIDPYHGERDLKEKILRHVSPAFEDDPLRVVRLARFAAYFPAFTIATETKFLAQKLATSGELSTLSLERITHEILKVYQYALNPIRFWEVLNELHALDSLFAGWEKILSKVLPFLKLMPKNLNYEEAFIYTMAHWQRACIENKIATPKQCLLLSSYYLKMIDNLIKAWLLLIELETSSFIVELVFLTKALQSPVIILSLWTMLNAPPFDREILLLIIHELKALETSWIMTLPPAQRSQQLKIFYKDFIDKFLQKNF